MADEPDVPEAYDHDVDPDLALSKPRGLARIKMVRNIADSLIKRSKLEISSLHISQPEGKSLAARGKIRLSHLGTGPLPLVGLQVKFKDPHSVSLHWPQVKNGDRRQISSSSQSITSSLGSNPALGPYVKVYIEPLSLEPSSPGSALSDVEMRIMVDDERRSAFVDFVRHMVRSDPQKGTKILLKASGVQVKAFGVRFGGLHLEKEVTVGGLGCLGGAIIFSDDSSSLSQKLSGPSMEKESSISSNPLESGGSIRKRLTLKNSFIGRKLSTNSIPQSSTQNSAVNFKTGSLSKTARKLEINDLDIVGGDPVYGIKVSSNVVIENPARSPELIVEPGELRFALCIYDEDAAKTHDAPTGPDALSPGLIRIGTITLAAACLRPGPNKLNATGYIKLPPLPKNDAVNEPTSYEMCAYIAGKGLIAKLMQNEKIDACAVATHHQDNDPFSGISPVGWLAEAFEGTRIDARIPPLGDRVRLLDGAELRVEGGDANSIRSGSPNVPVSPPLSTTRDLQGSVARASLRNSFGADIEVHNLSVKACTSPLVDDEGNTEVLELGNVTSSCETWNGLLLRKGCPTHVSLPMEINPDPKVLIEILRKSARSRQLDLGYPLTELLEDLRTAHWTEAGFAVPPRSRPSSSHGTSRGTSIDKGSNPSESIRKSSSRKNLNEDKASQDLAGTLAKALANMRVTAFVHADASIGGFRVPGGLTFEQRNLPIALSTATAAALLPLVGKPFVKALIDRAEIEVHAIDVLRMNDRGIEANVALQLVNFGPLSAQVLFENGLQLREVLSPPEAISANANSEDGVTPNVGRVLAVIYFDDILDVVAGDDEPVGIGARIVPCSGPESREKFGLFVSQLLKFDDVTYDALADPISITAGGVHFQASLQKAITLEGLGGFSDLRLDNIQILGEASAPAQGVSLSVAAPASTQKPTAIEFSASTRIRNKGSMYLRLSKLEVALALDGIEIGQASLDAVDLRPRRSVSLKAIGKLYAPPPRNVQAHRIALEKLSFLIERLLSGQEIHVQVLGRRAWVAHADDSVAHPSSVHTTMPRRSSSIPVSLAWLDEALRSFETKATIHWKGGVQLITDIDVRHVDVVFAARKDMQLKIDEIKATYTVPFPITFELQKIEANIEIVHNQHTIATCSATQKVQNTAEVEGKRNDENSQENKPVLPLIAHNTSHRPLSSASSTFSVPRSPTANQNKNAIPQNAPNLVGTVKLCLESFKLQEQLDENIHSSPLGKMIAHILDVGPEGSDQISLHGTAHASVKTALGILHISVPLGVGHKLEISGLDGLRSSPLRYDSMEVTSANPKYLQIKLNVHSHNPSSSLTICVPDSSLTLAAYYNNAFVGDIILGADGKGITLSPGHVNLPNTEFHFRPTSSSEANARPFVSRLFSGQSATLSVRGHKRSSINSALAQALTIVNVPIEVQPLGHGDLISRIRAQLGINVVTSNSIDAVYVLNNPLNLPIDILHLEVKATYRSKPFGTASKTYSKEGRPVKGTMTGTEGEAKNDSGPNSGTASGADTPSAVKNILSSQRSSKGSSPRSSTTPERLTIPPGVKNFEGAIVVKLGQPLDQLILAFLHERGSIALDVELSIRMDIDGFVLPAFDYTQEGVPLDISGLQGIARILRLV